MLQYMETVSQGEAENIRKTIQDLFRQTCILQVKCDPATLVQHDNPRYQVCLRHREFIADYLSVLDCELDVNWCMIRRNTFSGSRGMAL